MSIKPNNEIEIKKSIGDIYSELSKKRAEDRLKRKEEKEAKKLQKLEDKELHKEEKKNKKERLLDSENAYKDILKELTGEDIDYVEPKRKKRWKFTNWINDDKDTIMVGKPKKKKKKDYSKEFAPELSMLKTLVAEQNRFTNDLLKKFNLITKDGSMTKTSVDLAGNIVSSRSTALNILKEIGGIKKTMADLYYKKLKEEREAAALNGKGSLDDEINSTIMGSDIFSQMFNTNPIDVNENPFTTPCGPQELVQTYDIATPNIQPKLETQSSSIEDNFDPSTWNRKDLVTPHTLFENVPHTIICEWDRVNNRARFKAIRNDNGEELVGYPVPVIDPSKLTFDTDNMVVKGEFEDIYKLIIL